MSVIDILTRVDAICQKYDRSNVDKLNGANVAGEDPFAHLYASVDAEINECLEKAEAAKQEKNRATGPSLPPLPFSVLPIVHRVRFRLPPLGSPAPYSPSHGRMWRWQGSPANAARVREVTAVAQRRSWRRLTEAGVRQWLAAGGGRHGFTDLPEEESYLQNPSIRSALSKTTPKTSLPMVKPISF